MVGLHTAIMDLLQVVFCSVYAKILFQLHCDAILFAHHVFHRVKELLLAHLFDGWKDIESLSELINLWSLLREHLAHFEDLLT